MNEAEQLSLHIHITHTHTAQALEKRMGVALQLIFDDKKEGECIINVPWPLTSSIPLP